MNMNFQKISTQGLTVLITSVIVALEQENQVCFTGYFIR